MRVALAAAAMALIAGVAAFNSGRDAESAVSFGTPHDRPASGEAVTVARFRSPVSGRLDVVAERGTSAGELCMFLYKGNRRGGGICTFDVPKRDDLSEAIVTGVTRHEACRQTYIFGPVSKRVHHVTVRLADGQALAARIYEEAGAALRVPAHFFALAIAGAPHITAVTAFDARSHRLRTDDVSDRENVHLLCP